MAYNKTFNPDALPAHAEPDEAAQRMAAYHTHRPASQTPSNAPPTLPNRKPSPNIAPSYQGHPQSYQKPLPIQPPPQSQYQPPPPNHYQPPPPAGTPGLSAQPSYARLQSPPPPQNYGYGPPPMNPVAARPVVQNRPPRTPQPPDPDSAELFPLFRAADKTQNGTLTEDELSSALVNADYTAFDPHTIRVMMQMFDTTGKGSINYDEFVALWRFLAAWRGLFERFDEDRSGRLSSEEFSKSVVAFGYRLSPQFVTNLYNTFTRNRRAAGQGMSFDLFVQACTSLKRLTDTFKKYDDDRDGYITLSFEEFLLECLMLREYLVK